MPSDPLRARSCFLTGRGWVRLLVPLALILLLSAGPAVPQGHTHGIAAVMSQDLAAYREAVEGIRETAGQPVVVTQFPPYPEGEESVVRVLRSQAPNLIVALGARAAHMVKIRFPDVPTVYCMVLGADPSMLAGPLVTGVSLDVPEDRQIAAFKQVLPSLSRLGLLFDPSRSSALVERARKAAVKGGVQLRSEEVAGPGQVPAAFRRIASEVQGIWLIPDGTVVSRESFDFLLLESVERRIPIMVFSEAMVRAGGLLSLAPDNHQVGRQTGELAQRVLHGSARPLPPVEAPRDLHLILNLKTATALQIDISSEVLAKAAQVYR